MVVASAQSASPLEGVVMDPAQLRLMEDESRVIAVCWHRQKGKDFTTARKAVRHAIKTGETWYIVSLTQRQADATFDKCKLWARHYRAKFQQYAEQFDEYDADDDRTYTFNAREMRLPGGGRVISLPGKDADRLAGFTGNVIFTEFGLFPNGGQDHWRVVFPLTTRGHQVIVISTPRGKDTKFYELVHDPETYSVHLCDIHRSIAEGYVLRDNAGQPTDIETFKRLYGDEAGWRREYECEFTGDLESLIKWSKLEAAAAHGAGLDFDYRVVERDNWLLGFFNRELPEGGRMEWGWDVARSGDISALWGNHVRPGLPRHLRYLVLMRDCEFALQRLIVREAMDSPAAGRPGVGKGDATGLGMDSNETLTNHYPGRWEGVPFTVRNRSDLCSGLRTALGDGEQTLPDLGAHKFIATDLYALQAQPSEKSEDKTLKITYTKNALLPASHCDIAMAGGLAIAAGALDGIEAGVAAL